MPKPVLNNKKLLGLCRQWVVQEATLLKLMGLSKKVSSKTRQASAQVGRSIQAITNQVDDILKHELRLLGKAPRPKTPPANDGKRYKKVVALSGREYWFLMLGAIHRLRKTLVGVQDKTGADWLAAGTMRLLDDNLRHFVKLHVGLTLHADASSTELSSIVVSLMRQAAGMRYGEDLVEDIVHGTGDEGYFVGDPRNELDYSEVHAAYAKHRALLAP